MQDLIEKVQDSLNSYNIDSTACLQRAVCFSVQSTKAKTENHTTNNYENVLRQVVKYAVTLFTVFLQDFYFFKYFLTMQHKYKFLF